MNATGRLPALLALPILVFLSGDAGAQTELRASGTFGGSGVDDARCVLATSARTFVAGRLGSSAYVEAWAGTTLLWTRAFDATPGGPEHPSGLAHDGTGGIYLAGAASNAQLQGWRAFLVRIDATGAIQWSVERPPMPNPEWGPALLLHPTGRAILGGRAPANGGDFSITAISPAGAVEWEATHDSGLPAPDQIVDLALAPNGDVVGGGTTSHTNAPHPAVMRVTPLGAIVHATTIANADVTTGSCAAVAVDGADRTFVASSARASGAVVSALAVTALDAAGNELWTRTITGAQQPFGGGAGAVDLLVDPFGRVATLGTRAQGSSGRALVLVLHDRDGNELWRNVTSDVLGGPSTNLWNLPVGLAFVGSGEYVAAGHYGPALADTVADAFVLGVDMTGETRFGFTWTLPATSGGSFDFAATIAADPVSDFVIAGRGQVGPGTSDFDGFWRRYRRTTSEMCHADGLFTDPCPCGNSSPPGSRAGCANSLGTGGRLRDLGASSLAADSFVLVGSGMTNSTVQYFQASLASVPGPFGDGLSCAAGSLVRIGAKSNVGGASRYPTAGDPPVSVRGGVGGPGVRLYQAVYRNTAAFCTSATFNVTNALNVTWTP